MCPSETKTRIYSRMTLPRFHKSCAERAAETAGYFFKCPLCNNKEVFETEMKKFGVSSKPRPLVCVTAFSG